MNFSFSAPRCTLNDFRKEMESMTEIERENTYHELMGSLKLIEERPDFMIEKLVELRIHLDKKSDKAAYYEAQQKIPNFVNSIEFLSSFLRSTRFDAEFAANKIINYWRCKLDLFGPEVAFRPDGRIKISDLVKGDLATLDASGMCCLQKDKNNRGVLFIRRQKWIIDDGQSRGKHFMRLMWYLLQVMTEDPNMQRKGIVVVIYNFGEFSTDYYNRSVETFFGEMLNNVFPCRIAGVHLGFDSKVYELFLPFVLHLLGREMRSRLRLYTDTYSLMETLTDCGFPAPDILPKQVGGAFDVSAWKQERVCIENVPLSSDASSSGDVWVGLHQINSQRALKKIPDRFPVIKN